MIGKSFCFSLSLKMIMFLVNIFDFEKIGFDFFSARIGVLLLLVVFFVVFFFLFF